MKTVIRKWANSASVRIPAAVMRAAHLDLDQEVDIRDEGGAWLSSPYGLLRMSWRRCWTASPGTTCTAKSRPATLLGVKPGSDSSWSVNPLLSSRGSAVTEGPPGATAPVSPALAKTRKVSDDR